MLNVPRLYGSGVAADFCELVHNIDTDRVRMSEEVCRIDLEDLLIDMTLLTFFWNL